MSPVWNAIQFHVGFFRKTFCFEHLCATINGSAQPLEEKINDKKIKISDQTCKMYFQRKRRFECNIE